MVETRDIVRHCIPRYAQGKALDVGAGTAKYRNIIQQHTASYETLDLVPGPNVQHVGDAQDMPLPDSSYDTIFSFQTLEHVESAERVAAELFRVVKVGGRIIVTAPFLVPEHADPGDFRRFTKMGLEELFTNQGFTVVESGTYGGFWGVLHEFVKFKFLNPYSQKKYGRVYRKIISILEAMLTRLDRTFSKPTAIIYSNVYLVAEKM